MLKPTENWPLLLVETCWKVNNVGVKKNTVQLFENKF
jgi:hypothetical protein